MRRAEKAAQHWSPATALEKHRCAAEVSQRSPEGEEGKDGSRLFGPIYLPLNRKCDEREKRQESFAKRPLNSEGGRGVLTINSPQSDLSLLPPPLLIRKIALF